MGVERCCTGWKSSALMLIPALSLVASVSLAAERTPATARQLLDLSLEDLLNIEVTSVAKKSQPLSEVAAAAYVITQQDIRRSGVTSIPEALRLAPGVQVARIDANKWAVSIRGSNSRFANKLLVLIDGRSVYTPLFSGVFWDVQDTVLEDIERIEVIRGPGGTLWGANAVNGVVNIITKGAGETRGGLVSAGVGTEERGFGTVRYGGALGESAHYRVYGKYFNRDGGVELTGADGADDWDQARAGFRLDWQASAGDAMVLQGDIYDGKSGEKLQVPSPLPPFRTAVANDQDVAGGNLLARWTRSLADGSDMQLQLYYDRTERDSLLFRETRDTLDVDFQHRFPLLRINDIVWGLGYRYTGNQVGNTALVAVDPDSRHDQVFSAFLQDEITLIPKRLRLILGSKFEHNDYTGFEIQPSARLLWSPAENHALWAAVTRAVRTPSPADRDVTADTLIQGVASLPNLPLPVIARVSGDKHFDSEKLLAYELGYRMQLTESLALDAAAFYNDYDDARGSDIGEPVCDPSGIPLSSNPLCLFSAQRVVVPFSIENIPSATSYGFEVAADWRSTDRLRWKAYYAFLAEKHIHPSSPRHYVSLRSAVDVRPTVHADLWLRYVDSVDDFDIDSYLTLDVRLAWQALKNLELAIVGQNLLEPKHQEFLSELGDVPIAIQRSGYLQLRWQF